MGPSGLPQTRCLDKKHLKLLLHELSKARRALTQAYVMTLDDRISRAIDLIDEASKTYGECP